VARFGIALLGGFRRSSTCGYLCAGSNNAAVRSVTRGYRRCGGGTEPKEARRLWKLDLECRVSLVHKLQRQHRMAVMNVGVFCGGAGTAKVDVLGRGQVG